ncbi:general substrate transporter [Yamadazyma tenuis ATCC 10573]|uniref:General substrate transporter n=1 Tax=Candida tenuis (strain ATCC 10573 / BCRC 21748 / CBS 615 / JCM 9827 / NBRC 10315 / NRRL Y-1498 / VKM Y-70) TaxID=590646 RepID=G3B8E0_CANTC|nr:general substrate transporter [Yamadazyma tenuis ATCC 10573]EGV62378.1 general substrate transporter [Yamadazyma tenuis ATCC 10573]
MGYEAKLQGLALKFRGMLDKFPNTHNIFVISIVTCTAGLMFGFDISSMSAFISTSQYRDYFNAPDSTLQGIITASMALGSIFGSLASSFVSEPFGRRSSLMVCGIFWCIGAIIQTSTQNVGQLIGGRVVSGFGVGFGTAAAPVLVSELCPRTIRGRVGGLFQSAVTVGIMVMFFISYGCSQIDGTTSFRVAWGLQLIPGIGLIFGCFCIPESPRWLAKQGYWEDAEEIVAKVQAKGNREDENVLIEVSEIKEQILLDRDAKTFTYADLFTKKYLPRTITAIFAQTWQQLTGMNVMMYYIVYIFQMAGYGGGALLSSSSIQYVLFVVATIPSLYFLDKFGRRPVLLVGAAVMMGLHFAVGAILAVYANPVDNIDGDDTLKLEIPDSRKAAAKGVIACCYLFVCAFGTSWGTCIWVYCSEVWGDSACRQRGAAVSTCALLTFP